MIRIEGSYFIDENNNKWDIAKYSKRDAIRLSTTLFCCTGCKNCRDCFSCSYCTDCASCSGCSGCVNCSSCFYCTYCTDCVNCSHCFNCRDCYRCLYCSSCSKCIDCSYCRYCSDYKEQPMIYKTKKIGSRNANTTFYYDGKNNIQVVCGCFRGNLKQFEEAVLETHKNNSTFKEQYLKEIEKVKVLFDYEKR